jgi:hypothetical protein
MKTLDKTYNITITYPIRYTNQFNDIILTGDNPTIVYLSASGRGFDLLRLKMLSTSTPITIDLKKMKSLQMNQNDSFHYTIESKNFAEQFQNLSKNLIIKDIIPSTLRLTFARKVMRKVAINPLTSIQPLKQYILKRKPYVIPDSIVVSGPKNIVDTLKFLNTEVFNVNDNKPFVYRFVKIKPVAGVSYSRDEAVIYVEREKFTEKTISVPITVQNSPDSLSLKLFPSTIELKCNVGLSKYQSVSSTTIRAYVDYNAIQTSSKLEVHLSNFPENIQLIDYKPKSVDYIIEKWR